MILKKINHIEIEMIIKLAYHMHQHLQLFMFVMEYFKR